MITICLNHVEKNTKKRKLKPMHTIHNMYNIDGVGLFIFVIYITYLFNHSYTRIRTFSKISTYAHGWNLHNYKPSTPTIGVYTWFDRRFFSYAEASMTILRNGDNKILSVVCRKNYGTRLHYMY